MVVVRSLLLESKMSRKLKSSLLLFGPLECLIAYCDVRFRNCSSLKRERCHGPLEQAHIHEPKDQATITKCKAVRRYILRARQRHDDNFTCLMASVAAKNLLARKGVESSLYIGVQFEASMKNDQKNFRAHSWLKSGSFVVVGGEEITSYKVITVYD